MRTKKAVQGHIRHKYASSDTAKGETTKPKLQNYEVHKPS